MTLGLAGAFAAAAALMFFLVWSAVSSYTERRIADGIATDLKGFEDVFAQSGVRGLREAMDRRLSADPNRLYMLVGVDGERLTGNTTDWPNDAGAGDRLSFRDSQRGRRFDGATRTLSDGTRILLAHDRREHDSILRGLMRALILPALAALLLALGGGYFLTRATLARIEAVNAACSKVEAGDITARVAGFEGRSDEFGTLAAHVNAMLDRIERLMSSVQHLSDHIAHETRTPLARLRARLERARAEAAGDPMALAAFDDAITETQTIINVFASLLDITAAEAAEGDRRGLAPVDLAGTIADVVDLYEGVAEDRGVTLVHHAEAAAVLGDPMLLMRMIANVVDNAIKFSPQGGQVSITLRVLGDEAEVCIADQGPGIPDGFERDAFERFSRADSAASTPGHGLGLPLVRAIALRHGIKVALEAGNPGLRVIFRGALAAA